MKDKLEQLSAMLRKASNPALAKGPSAHVTQVWEDGEITSQKCGELLWQRTLHLLEPGVSQWSNVGAHAEIRALPEWTRYHMHGYIFCTLEDAREIRAAIIQLMHANK